MRVFAAVFPLLLFAASAAAEGPYEKWTFKGVQFHRYHAKSKNIRMYWKDDQGKQLYQFGNVFAYAKSQDEDLVFLMNGGIWEPSQIPSGLFIDRGELETPLNLRDAPGHFFWKPNGVWLIENGKSRILTSLTYAKEQPKPDYAVQSGPMLVIGGKVNARLKDRVSKRLVRNGVGVHANGDVVFLTSIFKGKLGAVDVIDLAEAFLDQGCTDALYLDGDLCLNWVKGEGMRFPANSYASVIGVVAEKD